MFKYKMKENHAGIIGPRLQGEIVSTPKKKVTKPTTMKTALEILGRKLVFLQGNIRQAFTKRRDLLVLRSS